MSGEITMTVHGNLTADPEPKRLNDGGMLVSFSVANSPSKFNRTTGKYENGATTYINCKAFNRLAEHALATLHKGDRVIVTGTFSQREYTTKQGEKRRVYELTATDIGASLQWATGVLTREGHANSYGQQQPSTGFDPWSA